MKRRLADQFLISKGSHLLGDRNELSGYKTVTIRDRLAFQAVVNAIVSEELAKQEPGETPEQEEVVRNLKAAAARGHEWLRTAPG